MIQLPRKTKGLPMKINLMNLMARAASGAGLGVPRDRLLSCLRALHEADQTGAGLHLVERLLFTLMQREGRSVH
jgi:hypothetical protein